MLTPTSSPTPTANLLQKAAMLGAEASEPKTTVKKKKHPRIVHVLKEFIGATTITKCILGLEINLTVGELLFSASDDEKQFTKTITKDKTMQFSVITLKSSTVDA